MGGWAGPLSLPPSSLDSLYLMCLRVADMTHDQVQQIKAEINTCIQEICGRYLVEPGPISLSYDLPPDIQWVQVNFSITEPL